MEQARQEGLMAMQHALGSSPRFWSDDSGALSLLKPKAEAEAKKSAVVEAVFIIVSRSQ
jgi:hypothetical protein